MFWPGTRPTMNDFDQQSRRTIAATCSARPRHGHVLGVSKVAFHRIAYTEWGPEDARRIVVCVHGLTRQGRDFDRLAAFLAQHGYRVICPDLPGRGRSDWLTNPDDYGLPQYCMDMTVLLAKSQTESVDWIGTSLGGLVGMVMAALPGSPIRRLVVNDIGPFLAWPALYRIGTYLRQMPTEFRDFAAANAYYREILSPFGQLEDQDWHHLVEHSMERTENGRYRVLCDPGIARAFRPGLLYNLNLWKYWDAIRCRTLLLRGEHSDLLLRDTAEQMTRRGPRATFVEVPGCGHAPPLLARQQIDIVADWLGA
jgi:pimeloyl-ACP methyl ester carboxylesterase